MRKQVWILGFLFTVSIGWAGENREYTDFCMKVLLARSEKVEPNPQFVLAPLEGSATPLFSPSQLRVHSLLKAFDVFSELRLVDWVASQVATTGITFLEPQQVQAIAILLLSEIDIDRSPGEFTAPVKGFLGWKKPTLRQREQLWAALEESFKTQFAELELWIWNWFRTQRHRSENIYRVPEAIWISKWNPKSNFHSFTIMVQQAVGQWHEYPGAAKLWGLSRLTLEQVLELRGKSYRLEGKAGEFFSRRMLDLKGVFVPRDLERRGEEEYRNAFEVLETRAELEDYKTLRGRGYSHQESLEIVRDLYWEGYRPAFVDLEMYQKLMHKVPRSVALFFPWTDPVLVLRAYQLGLLDPEKVEERGARWEWLSDVPVFPHHRDWEGTEAKLRKHLETLFPETQVLEKALQYWTGKEVMEIRQSGDLEKAVGLVRSGIPTDVARRLAGVRHSPELLRYFHGVLNLHFPKGWDLLASHTPDQLADVLTEQGKKLDALAYIEALNRGATPGLALEFGLLHQEAPGWPEARSFVRKQAYWANAANHSPQVAFEIVRTFLQVAFRDFQGRAPITNFTGAPWTLRGRK